jgi:hypothetical protein
MCPEGSKPTRLIKGMCGGHYWADLQSRKSKKIYQSRPDNPLSQSSDNQTKGAGDFIGYIPSLKSGIIGIDGSGEEKVTAGELEKRFLDQGQSPHDPDLNQNSESPINQALLNLKNARNPPEKIKYNPIPEYIEIQTLSDWYYYQVLHCDWICENCRNPIIAVSEGEKISCQAHILPKEYFPSVALHPLNHLLLAGFLSDCGCHYKYDFSWEKAVKMPVFELAISRFLSFKKHLSVKEYMRLPDPFKKYL